MSNKHTEGPIYVVETYLGHTLEQSRQSFDGDPYEAISKRGGSGLVDTTQFLRSGFLSSMQPDIKLIEFNRLFEKYLYLSSARSLGFAEMGFDCTTEEVEVFEMNGSLVYGTISNREQDLLEETICVSDKDGNSGVPLSPGEVEKEIELTQSLLNECAADESFKRYEIQKKYKIQNVFEFGVLDSRFDRANSLAITMRSTLENHILGIDKWEALDV
jgi:hypothetical protein